MFLVSDRVEGRRAKIKRFLRDDPAIAVLLASADFEWTIRRAILLLGKDPNTEIRAKDLKRASGFWQYEKAWRSQVEVTCNKSLRDVLGLSEEDRRFFEERAIQLRHDLIHGTQGGVTRKLATASVETILARTKTIIDFVSARGKNVYERLNARRA